MLLHLERSFYICPAKFLLDYELLLEFTISCRGVLCCVVSCRVVLCCVPWRCAALFCSVLVVMVCVMVNHLNFVNLEKYSFPRILV